MRKRRRWSLGTGVTFMLVLSALTTASGAVKPWKIGILQMTSVLDIGVEAFTRRMEELGYRESETVQYTYRNANGSLPKLHTYAQELVTIPVDLLFTVTTAATAAAKAATMQSRIPIVFTAVMYPQEAGFVEQIEQPGGWITGASPLVLASKQLEILTQLVPHLHTLGVVYAAEDHPQVMAQLRQAARARQLALQAIAVKYPQEVAGAVATLVQTVDALYIPPDNVVTTQMEAIVQTALAGKTPVMVPTDAGVKQGALISYAADYKELAVFAADMAHKILHGEKPADMPVEYPVKPKLTINLTTSRVIDLSIPPALLFLADEVMGSLDAQ